MSDKALIFKTNVRSPVWQYFGFYPDEFGLPDDSNRPVCKICLKRVVSREGK